MANGRADEEADADSCAEDELCLGTHRHGEEDCLLDVGRGGRLTHALAVVVVIKEIADEVVSVANGADVREWVPCHTSEKASVEFGNRIC